MSQRDTRERPSGRFFVGHMWATRPTFALAKAIYITEWHHENSLKHWVFEECQRVVKPYGTDLKTVEPRGSEGSNPSPTATNPLFLGAFFACCKWYQMGPLLLCVHCVCIQKPIRQEIHQ